MHSLPRSIPVDHVAFLFLPLVEGHTLPSWRVRADIFMLTRSPITSRSSLRSRTPHSSYLTKTKQTLHSHTLAHAKHKHPRQDDPVNQPVQRLSRLLHISSPRQLHKSSRGQVRQCKLSQNNLYAHAHNHRTTTLRQFHTK